jgi:O-antigen/teichoic acid export membrane protein
MIVKHRLTIGWVAAGQGLSALGTVVGLRILTQYLEPAMFGVVSLALGAAALALGLTCTPLTQAAMYFYPSLAPQGGATVLAGALRRGWIRTLPWLLVGGAIVAVPYVSVGSGSIWLVVATAALLVSDVWRSVNLCLLNAAADHKRYGIWMALEAWGRPLCATVAVLLVSRSPVAVLGAYAALSLALNLVLSKRPPEVGTATPPVADFDRQMWQYALPLVPLGLLGWANGLSDRYIISGLLSLQDTGIYAAAYGLASRPLLLVNATFEQLMRPIYQNAVSAGHTERAALLLRYWVMALAAACGLLVLIVSLWRHELAAILLGARFRSGANLMPWIAAGYGVLSLAYVFERVCLAHAHTQRVLAVELVSGIAMLLMTVIGVHFWGLIGAACAVPLYFGVQLCVAIILSRHSQNVYRYRPT